MILKHQGVGSDIPRTLIFCLLTFCRGALDEELEFSVRNDDGDVEKISILATKKVSATTSSEAVVAN